MREELRWSESSAAVKRMGRYCGIEMAIGVPVESLIERSLTVTAKGPVYGKDVRRIDCV